MGTLLEMNDTLRLNKAQGFPTVLDIDKHLAKPYTAELFANRIFEFKDKMRLRIYQVPPVRNFLVETIDGEWIYWGLIHILEISHDYLKNTTSGKYKIIYIYTPEEMKQVFNLTDRIKDNNYFA